MLLFEMEGVLVRLIINKGEIMKKANFLLIVIVMIGFSSHAKDKCSLAKNKIVLENEADRDARVVVGYGYRDSSKEFGLGKFSCSKVPIYRGKEMINYVIIQPKKPLQSQQEPVKGLGLFKFYSKAPRHRLENKLAGKRHSYSLESYGRGSKIDLVNPLQRLDCNELKGSIEGTIRFGRAGSIINLFCRDGDGNIVNKVTMFTGGLNY